MNSLQVQVLKKTDSGAVHVQLKEGEDDLGVLYLTADQYHTILGTLRVGCFNKDVDFSVTDPYNEEEDENIFLSID
jgi:hypothetical protein